MTSPKAAEQASRNREGRHTQPPVANSRLPIVPVDSPPELHAIRDAVRLAIGEHKARGRAIVVDRGDGVEVIAAEDIPVEWLMDPAGERFPPDPRLTGRTLGAELR